MSISARSSSMSLPEGFELRRGRLFVEGLCAAAMARRFGTPLYAYAGGAIVERYRRFRAAFSARETLLCYALKANPLGRLARLLALQGAGCDVVSGGELVRALAAGFKPERIVFSGVGKTDDELRAGLRAGLLAFNVESRDELDRLSRAARQLRRKAAFAVRVNPDIRAGGHAHIVTGLAETKFGVEATEAIDLYRRAVRSRLLHPVGLQCHLGSQIVAVGPYRKALDRLVALLDRLGGLGVRLGHLDLGGGMGIGYDGGPGLAPESLARAVLPALKGRRERLLFEPGRWLVGSAGVLLSRVLSIKNTSRKRFVVVDAAMNDLLRPALYDARHRVVPARPRRGRLSEVDIVGPVCETADFLARGAMLQPLRAGDLVAVLDAGAYGSSMGSQYNSRLRPAEVLVHNGSARLARRRETMKDLVRHEL